MTGIAVAVVGLTLPACGEEDDGVTYADDVRSIFNRRCTTCHRTGSPIQVDIQDPFSDVECETVGTEQICNGGLVNMPNTWHERDPSLPERNVVPGEPDASFLMMKLTGDLPSNGDGGEPMPLQVEWDTKEQDIALLEDWITAGAPATAPFPSGNEMRQFSPDVEAIFGTQDGRSYTGGKCLFCHYQDTPNPPNLSAPFSPQGVVNVRAIYRGDRVRVVPGNPDDSFLIQKVRADRPEADIGAQMPYSYTALTDSDVETVRQWILQGARP